MSDCVDLVGSPAPSASKKDKALEPKAPFIHCDGILLEAFEDDMLLYSSTSKRVVSLNETAQVFWDVLAFGSSIDDCCQLLLEADAAQDVGVLQAQVRALFELLSEQGFIRPA